MITVLRIAGALIATLVVSAAAWNAIRYLQLEGFVPSFASAASPIIASMAAGLLSFAAIVSMSARQSKHAFRGRRERIQRDSRSHPYAASRRRLRQKELEETHADLRKMADELIEHHSNAHSNIPPPVLASVSPPKPPQPAVEARTKQIAGALVRNIPVRMFVGKTERTEIRLGEASPTGGPSPQLLMGMPGDIQTSDVELVDTMSIQLTGEPVDFQIRPLSPSKQRVTPPKHGEPRSAQGYGKWRFDVTPLRKGNLELVIVITGISNLHGVESHVPLPEEKRFVQVKVSAGRRLGMIFKPLRSGLIWITGIIIAAAISATPHIWWPFLQDLIRPQLNQAGIVSPEADDITSEAPTP